MPNVGEDTVLTGGKTAKEFFEARAQQTDCRTNLLAIWILIKKLRQELKDLIKAGASADDIDAKEIRCKRCKKLSFFSSQGPMQTCGPCATQELSENKERRQVWYVTDGSCYFEGTVYDQAAKFLRNTGDYSNPSGGFHSILDFYPIDPASGNQLPQVESVDMAVPLKYFYLCSRTAWVRLSTTFSQITFPKSKQAAKKSFTVLFNTIPRPPGHNNPDIYDVSASGAKKKMHTWDLNTVQECGILIPKVISVITTAADFGADLPLFFASSARPTLFRNRFLTLLKGAFRSDSPLQPT